MAKYRFDQIAINSIEKKKPVEEDRFTYIGLEHLDSGSLTVSRYGSDVAPVGEKLIMHKGDVLFGKRRAYQKKVAIAPFDGILSAHGMVLRPREEVVDKGFFPLFISSDYFLNAAIQISVGSLSPTINWKDLRELEFELPDLETQRKLSDALWAIINTAEAYKRLITVSDELVKSQFISEFGDPMTNSKGYRLTTYGEVFELNAGGTPSKRNQEYWENGTISWIGSNMCQDEIIYENDGQFITEEGFKHSSARLFPPDTVLVALVGATIGKTALLKFETTTNQNVLGIRNIVESGYTPEFVFYYTQMIHEMFLAKGDGFLMASKTMISGFPIPIVDADHQKRYSSFVQQLDKSKHSAQKALEDLKATQKALIRKYLG